MNNFDDPVATVADAARRSLADAQVEGGGQARFIAGGTNLLDLMKENLLRPTWLVDISRLPWDGIEVLEDGGVRLGALAPARVGTLVAWSTAILKQWADCSQQRRWPCGADAWCWLARRERAIS